MTVCQPASRGHVELQTRLREYVSSVTRTQNIQLAVFLVSWNQNEVKKVLITVFVGDSQKPQNSRRFYMGEWPGHCLVMGSLLLSLVNAYFVWTLR